MNIQKDDSLQTHCLKIAILALKPVGVPLLEPTASNYQRRVSDKCLFCFHLPICKIQKVAALLVNCIVESIM